jgi:hypothetical protein
MTSRSIILLVQKLNTSKSQTYEVYFQRKTLYFDWIPKFFSGTNNKNWLENVCKITMVGNSVKREILISKKKENFEKKIPACISKIMIPSYVKKKPYIEGLNLAVDCWIVKPTPALITP